MHTLVGPESSQHESKLGITGPQARSCDICKRILFMKLVKLPRGKQKDIRGAAVNVPADLGPACTLLPRLPADAHIVSLKLK